MCSKTELVPQLESILMNTCSFIYYHLYPYIFLLFCLHCGELSRIKGPDACSYKFQLGRHNAVKSLYQVPKMTLVNPSGHETWSGECGAMVGGASRSRRCLCSERVEPRAMKCVRSSTMALHNLQLGSLGVKPVDLTQKQEASCSNHPTTNKQSDELLRQVANVCIYI